MGELTSAMRASLGHLRLTADPPLRFIGDRGSREAVEIRPPGALVGRDETADVVLPETEAYVSRRHLLIEPYGLEWILTDLGSSHGTRLRRSGRSAWDLPPHVPFPLATGDRLFLAGGSGINVEVVAQATSGARTKKAPPPGSSDERLEPDLAEFVLEMLRADRERPGALAVPPAEVLADRFGVSPRTIYNWRDRLLKRDRVSRNLVVRGRKASLAEVADAAAVAYPYLKRTA